MILFIVPKNSGLEKAREAAKDFSGELIEVRGEDVPSFTCKLIKEGKTAIGITGEDLFKEFLLETKENSVSAIKTIEWKDENFIFKKPALCLLGARNKELPKKLKICINRKYKELAKKYTSVLENKGYQIEKIYASGATEEFFSKGIVDAVIDIVCSGKSIEKYNLEIYEKLFESNIVIIGKEDEFDFQALYDKINKRIAEGDEKSYTKKLVNNPNFLRRKIVEEAAEVITENTENGENLVEEFADLIYNILVYMAINNISIKDIEEENARRNKETLLNPKNIDKITNEVTEKWKK